MPAVTNYTTLVLSPEGGILYAGAREMLLALQTSAFYPGPHHRLVSAGQPAPGQEGTAGSSPPCCVLPELHGGGVSAAWNQPRQLVGEEEKVVLLVSDGGGVGEHTSLSPFHCMSA